MQTPFSKKARNVRTAFLAQYQSQLGLRPVPRRQKIDRTFMSDLAAAWQDARHAPNDPVVELHYRRFCDETLLQFRFLEAEGVTFELTDAISPYKDMIDLVRDLDVNGRVRVWSGGLLPAGHPLGQTGHVPGCPTWRTLDALRGVHEVFGHAVGNSFKTQLGEELAFQDHRALFTEAAWPTLTSEFRAPLAWLMFGPHLGSNDGTRWQDRPYPPQKAVALPARFWHRSNGV